MKRNLFLNTLNSIPKGKVAYNNFNKDGRMTHAFVYKYKYPASKMKRWTIKFDQ